MSIDIIANFIIRFLVGILFIAAYTYIQKLEDAGCDCSNHPNRSFIKTFSLVGVIYLVFTMFVTPKMIIENVGKEGAAVYTFLDLVFLVTSVVYFYQTIVYVRYLINEKCKCSEDMRRELIMWGSLIELIMIVQVLLLSMIIPIVGECSMAALNTISSTKKGLSDAIHEPISAISGTPKNVEKIMTKSYNTSKKVLDKMAKELTAQK